MQSARAAKNVGSVPIAIRRDPPHGARGKVAAELRRVVLIEVRAQIATASPLATSSRLNAAAMRSNSAARPP